MTEFKYLSNKDLDEARTQFLSEAEACGFVGGPEELKVTDGFGRYTYKAVHAANSAPHYNAAAMDGIAVRAADTFGATEAAPVTLTRDRFVRVDTGDPMPSDADAVVMIEDVHVAEDGTVKLLSAVSPWTNVRQVGEDICMGDTIAVSGTRVTPMLQGAFLASGVLSFSAFRKPVFGIIPTGDEIVSPTADPKPGEIMEFNSVIFRSMLAEWDAESVIYDPVPDRMELLSAALDRALDECDAVLILAGSSAGRDDYTCTLIEKRGYVLTHGIAVKPGKPAALGFADRKPVIGLPGYPVSAMVIMQEIVRPLTDVWYRRVAESCRLLSAELTRNVVSGLKYKEFVRVSLGKVGDRYFAVPLPRGAGVVTSVTKADGILEIPQNSEGVREGSAVNIRLLRSEEEVSRSLVITGSHDPLIDEVADLLRRNGAPFTVVSSHVGSMGAFSAIKKEQAHMGGVHLLDPETGEYNKSYVEKYFPDGGAVLFHGVGREQGFMVPKGNPLSIRSVSDLCRCTFVNRQLGAGTRVLLDYFLQKEGIPAGAVKGYANVKFTHTAVAATVAAGNADVGLGIYSAAKMYGLDFIPLYNEEYDFLVAERFADDPMIRMFFDVLHSEACRKRLSEMGGYTY